jgi:hypothetical protein
VKSANYEVPHYVSTAVNPRVTVCNIRSWFSVVELISDAYDSRDSCWTGLFSRHVFLYIQYEAFIVLEGYKTVWVKWNANHISSEVCWHRHTSFNTIRFQMRYCESLCGVNTPKNSFWFRQLLLVFGGLWREVYISSTTANLCYWYGIFCFLFLGVKKYCSAFPPPPPHPSFVRLSVRTQTSHL